jgi:UPF0755 protein
MRRRCYAKSSWVTGRKRRSNSGKNIAWFFLIIVIIGTGYLYNAGRIEKKAAALKAQASLKAEKEITIVPGWNLKNIGVYLAGEGLALKENILNLKASDYSASYDFLKDAPKNATLEGYIFPDTYRVYASSTLNDIIVKTLNNFDNKLSAVDRTEIKNQGKTIYEVMTMAAVIEKEVKSAADMKIVAGIFWDRIKNGQALQSCATLAYILNENKAQYSYEETRTPSPYNTYINRGLPPGPICSPSANAITAVIYPTKTDYNYFLTDPATSQTIFSATYDEHLKNKNKYLK